MSHERTADHVLRITTITEALNTAARAHKRGEETEVVAYVSDFVNATQEAKKDGVHRQTIAAAIDSGVRKVKGNKPTEDLRNLH
jgi:hypothetical protein